MDVVVFSPGWFLPEMGPRWAAAVRARSTGSIWGQFHDSRNLGPRGQTLLAPLAGRLSASPKSKEIKNH
jgi:hypothetical protein